MNYALRIEDYALLGDGRTAALVGRNGSIDWLCWPRFDSEACFAALLGEPDHGHWRIAPPDPAAMGRRAYRPGTLVLDTVFSDAGGSATVTDFMPQGLGTSSVARLVTGGPGRMALRMTLALRFDYGSAMPWNQLLDGEPGAMCSIAGPDLVVLRCGLPLSVEGVEQPTIEVDFTVSEGQVVAFVLTHGESHLAPPAPIDAQAALRDTLASWQHWSARSTYRGDWPEIVGQSLAALRALVHQPTGGIVAAPTTSLPEALGGSRNWDYRFCWLRDATVTLHALMDAGYNEEARAWRAWLHRSVAGRIEQMQILYGVAGERMLDEWEAHWLPGYQGASPVRIGNAAMSQLQIDVFGEVMNGLHMLRRQGVSSIPADWQLQRDLAEQLERLWDQPDEGIWEVRGKRRHFTYSKVMAWVALDRAIRDAEAHGLDGPLDRWRALRTRIHDEVCTLGFDTAQNSFVQSYDLKDLDGSLLLLPACGFLPPDDPRIRGTVAAVERELLQDGLVLRYRSHESLDGMPPGEGVFLACSFWLADCMQLDGRQDEARALFERLLALRNDVGLFSEEYDPASKRMTGNFPQAFTHASLVHTAFRLSRPPPKRAAPGTKTA